MSQQLNLYDRSLQRQRSWGLGSVGLGLGGLMLVCAGIALLLQLGNRQSMGYLNETEASLKVAQARLQAGQALAPAALILDVQHLRALDEAQRRLRSLIESGAVGRRSGHAVWLLALAQQSHPAVWLTGLTIGTDSDALELQGRMLEAAALPDYLRRLNAEPQFKGRQFAQLQLRRVEADSDGQGGGYSEFTLRSQVGGSSDDKNGGDPALKTLAQLIPAR